MRKINKPAATTKPATKPAKPVSTGRAAITKPAAKHAAASIIGNVAKPAAKPSTGAAAAILAAAATAQANAGRSNVAKPVAAATTVDATAPRPASFGIARTARTVEKLATNFGGTLSDRDNAYLRHYGDLCRTLSTRTLTLRQIAENSPNASTGKPINPHYVGSAKAHDAGVCVRLSKAGLLAVRENGNVLAFTDAAFSHAAFGSRPAATTKPAKRA